MQNFEDADTDDLETDINGALMQLNEWKASTRPIPAVEMKAMVTRLNGLGDRVLMLSRSNQRAQHIDDRFKKADALLQQVFHRVAPVKVPLLRRVEGAEEKTGTVSWVNPVVPSVPRDGMARSESLYIEANNPNTRSETILPRVSPRIPISMGRSAGKIRLQQGRSAGSAPSSPRRAVIENSDGDDADADADNCDADNDNGNGMDGRKNDSEGESDDSAPPSARQRNGDIVDAPSPRSQSPRPGARPLPPPSSSPGSSSPRARPMPLLPASTGTIVPPLQKSKSASGPLMVRSNKPLPSRPDGGSSSPRSPSPFSASSPSFSSSSPRPAAEDENSIYTLAAPDANPVLRAKLLRFAGQKYAAENVEFIFEVVRIKSLADPRQLKAALANLKAKYLDSSAESEVNLSGNVKKCALESIANGELSGVEFAMREVESQIFSSLWVPFLATLEGGSLSQALGATSSSLSSPRKPPSPRPGAGGARALKVTILHARDVDDQREHWVSLSCGEFSAQTPHCKGANPSWSAAIVVPSVKAGDDVITLQLCSCQPIRGIKKLLPQSSGATKQSSDAAVGTISVPIAHVVQAFESEGGALMYVYSIPRYRSASLTVALSSAHTIVASSHRKRALSQITSFVPDLGDSHWRRTTDAVADARIFYREEAVATPSSPRPDEQVHHPPPPPRILDLLKEDGAFLSSASAMDEVHAWLLRSTTASLDRVSRWRNPVSGRTLLHYAVLAGPRMVEGLRALLKAKADMSALDQLEFSPVHYACLCGDSEILTILLEEDYRLADPLAPLLGERLSPTLDCVGAMGLTPLMVACVKRRLSCLRLLIENKCVLDLRDVNGCTALMHAAFHGFDDCVSLLMACRASVVGETADLSSPLMIALEQGHKKIAQLFMTNPTTDLNLVSVRGSSALWIAISHQMYDMMDALLQNANLDLEMPLGAHRWTVLMRALYELDDIVLAKVVPRLLAHGARPDTTNDSGKNSLFFAVAVGSKRTATQLILQAMGSPADAVSQSVDAFDNTPLHFVLDEGVAALLVAAGFSPRAANKAGNTPLHVCYALNFLSLAKFFESHLKKKEVKPNKHGHAPADLVGVGVERSLPFFLEDKPLKEFAGLMIKDGAMASRHLEKVVHRTLENF